MMEQPDVVGYQTLEAFNDAPKFNRWLYDTMSPFVGSSVLEIGSGIGNITSLIKAEKILATDYSEQYVAVLKQKFAGDSRIRIERLDAGDGGDFRKLKNTPVDTILCSNVLEHIKDDQATVHNFFQVLCPGGRLLLLVPFSEKLYCGYDEELGHFRRYSRRSVRAVVEKNGFTVEKIFLFNFFGGIGWFLLGKVLKRRQLNGGAIGLYEKFVPVFSLLEKFGTPFGASVICIARKP